MIPRYYKFQSQVIPKTKSVLRTFAPESSSEHKAEVAKAGRLPIVLKSPQHEILRLSLDPELVCGLNSD